MELIFNITLEKRTLELVPAFHSSHNLQVITSYSDN